MLHSLFPTRQFSFRLAIFCLFAASILIGNSAVGQTENEIPFASIAKQIPKSNTEVFAINDLVGHVDAVLNSKSLQRVLSEGSLGEYLRMVGAPGIDLQDARDWMDDYRQFFPSNISVSSDDQVYSFFVDAMEALLRLNMAEKTLYTDEFDKKEMELLEEELLEIFQQTKLPNLTIWIQWADQETGKELFDMFEQQAAVVDMFTELSYEEVDGGFEISGLMEDVSDAESIGMFFEFMGVEDSEGDLLNTILELEIFFQAKFVDGGIRVSIGKNTNDDPRATADDLVGLRNGPMEIAFAQWNGKALQESITRMDNSLNAWGDRQLGEMFRADDIEDLWGTYQGMIDQMQLLASEGSIRIWRDENKILATMLENGMPDVISLEGSDVLSMVSQDTESYYFSAEQSMADLLIAYLDYFEGRMATQSMKSEFQGDFDGANFLESLIYGYYEHFGPFRDSIRNEMAELEAVPFGMVIDTSGKLDSFDIEFDAEAIDAADLPKPISMKLDQFVQLAAISQTEQPEALKSKIIESYEHLIIGALSAADITPPSDLSLFEEIDLGSGIVGQQMSLQWIEKVKLGTLSIKGDFQPHVFIKDDFVVVSTSEKLSRILLTNENPVSIPELAEGMDLVGFGRIQGKTFGNFLRNAMHAAGAIVQSQLDDDVDFQLDQGMNMMANGMAEIVQIMNHFDWKSTQGKGVRESNFEVDFQDK